MTKKIFLLFLALLAGLSVYFLAGFLTGKTPIQSVLAAEEESDYELYLKYSNYLKYKKYRDYKKYKEKYGFADSAERLSYKNKYDLYKENPKKYARYYDAYKRYKDYKNKYKDKYAEYSKYSKYNKDTYSKYGKTKYKNGYNRYKGSLGTSVASEGVAAPAGGLGPEISIGLINMDSAAAKKSSFDFNANKTYNVKDKDGSVIATVAASAKTHVMYAGDGNVRVYGDGFDRTVSSNVNLDSADGNNDDIVFDVEPKSSFDKYRGKIRVRYSEDSKKLWVINILPLEQYAWGMGEITGTGPKEYNKVMSLTFRTYGYWKIKYSTIYASEGFKVDTTASSQVYYGYDWEVAHPEIREAVEATRGQIVKYEGKIAITPYSSSTDGKTRSWKDVWGSSNYPWCKSVDDPYGKVSNAASIAGNHMVGLSARGALKLADDHGWSYQKILKYYYTGIDIAQEY